MITKEENKKKFINIIESMKDDFNIKYKVLKSKIIFSINDEDAEYNLTTNIVKSFEYIDLPLEEYTQSIIDSKNHFKALFKELSKNNNNDDLGMVYLGEDMWLTSDGNIISY